ncbi:MAG: integrin alpha, partial [Planctomycetota bacterium]
MDIETSDLNGTNGFKLIGDNSGDQTGFSVDIVGDFNGDGIDDFVIGAPGLTVLGPSGNGSGQSDEVGGAYL